MNREEDDGMRHGGLVPSYEERQEAKATRSSTRETNSAIAPIALPVTLHHWNTPMGDTGDYNGHTEIRDANGRPVCYWPDADEIQEERAEEIVRALNRTAPSAIAAAKGLREAANLAELVRGSLEADNYLGCAANLRTIQRKIEAALSIRAEVETPGAWSCAKSPSCKQWCGDLAKCVATGLSK